VLENLIKQCDWMARRITPFTFQGRGFPSLHRFSSLIQKKGASRHLSFRREIRNCGNESDVGRVAAAQRRLLAAILGLMKPVTHRLAEERSLALHREVARRLKVDPALLETARERVQGWLESGFV
jgi:hypothetical protein